MKTRLFNFLVFLFICTSSHAQLRIIGGTAIDISQRPYQAAIFINGEFQGGGVIINNQWILTAAHVVYGKATSTISVSTGYTNLNNDPARSSVSQVIIHPDYVYSTSIVPNDIALIKLSSSLSFSANRTPVNISKSTSYASGTTAFTSGWGRRYAGGAASLNQLYKTNVTITSSANKLLTAQASNTSPYEGDSGGPLTISSTDGDLLIGIVLGGSNPSTSPFYFLNIGNYYNWIASYVSLYSISGPDLLCNGSTATFTISAPGATLELSPNLSIVSQSGKNYTIKGNYNGRAYINILAGNTYLARKSLWVGAPIISGISYNGSTLTAETFGGDACISRTEWTIGGNVFTTYSKSISSPYSSGTYTVSVRGVNSCGTGTYYTTQISFSDRGTFSLTVEPDSRIVTVTPIPREDDETAPVMASRKSTANATMRYVLADLTSGSLKATGYMPESGGTLDFSGASAGMYVFKLYTSTGAEETFKISLK